MQKNSFYKNPERGRQAVPGPQTQCMGMHPNRPKTEQESFGQWQMDGSRCRLLPRPFFCPVHLHIIKEKLGCCAVIDEELVGGVLEGLPDDDPWMKAEISELVLRANGAMEPGDIYNPTEKDRSGG